MIELQDGSFVSAEAITAIRVLPRLSKDVTRGRYKTIMPRVCVDFSPYSKVIDCKSLREARAYASQLHGEINAEMKGR